MTEFKEKAPHQIRGSRSSREVDSEEEIGYFGPFSVYVLVHSATLSIF